MDTFLARGAARPRGLLRRDGDEFKVETDRKSVHKVHGVGPFGVEWCASCSARTRAPRSSSPRAAGRIAPFVAWRKRAAKAEMPDPS